MLTGRLRRYTLCVYSYVYVQASVESTHHPSPWRLTLGGGVVVRGPPYQLLPPAAQGGEGGQQLVQLQALGPVLAQLLPDLVHLGSHRWGLTQSLDRTLQGLQQRVHLVVELGEGGRRRGGSETGQEGGGR